MRNKTYKPQLHRGLLKQIGAAQNMPAYMRNKSLGAFFFGLFLFFILTIKHDDASTAAETQAVPYFALCIIKKIASSILIPKSLL